MKTTSQTRSRGKTITLWTLQILVAAAFIGAGSAKLASAPMMVQIFDHIGVGQWFRYVTGIVEVAGGIMVLLPRTAPFGGVLLAVTMACAICVHLLRIGGNPAPAFVLLVLSAAIAWLRRDQLASLLSSARSTSTSA
ncbi:DoxX family protein [Paraburkholderia caffeinilytica]|uniref:DoxX family protein n=1 Tax=Paraburkholderia caffeinilytica TaxID=1761016 RepID=UPI003DA08512